MLNLLQS